MPDVDRIVAEERPQHVDVTMREVNNLDNPVDHRVSQSQQRIDAAKRETVDQLLHKDLHGWCPLSLIT